jgi:hypothetical protein
LEGEATWTLLLIFAEGKCKKAVEFVVEAIQQSRRKAAHAVAASNWKEAQRQLDESLQAIK